MRRFLIAVLLPLAVVGVAAGSAQAQVMTGGVGAQGYPVPGPGWGGGYVGGQWIGGVNAPGGWPAYRPARRGWRMPGYWRSPDFRVQNYAMFGLAPPPPGYGWSRYYDDAVLIDADGRVYDSVGGIDWRRVDQPYATGYGYPSQGYWNAPGGGYAYAQGGQGGQGGVAYTPAPQAQYGYGYGYQGGGYIAGSSASATVEFDQGAAMHRPDTTTTTTTTTTTEEWVSQPVTTYVPVRERVVYRQGPARIVYKQAPPQVVYKEGPTKVVYRESPPKVVYRDSPPKIVYRTVVKEVPVRAPRRPRPTATWDSRCERGKVCGS